VPARFAPSRPRIRHANRREITRKLDVTGLLAVEFFLTSDGTLLVNELAPRPHNSGRFAFDACVTEPV
jgi:5-(carboxyamino)imidazole ribonucleotide synthase